MSLPSALQLVPQLHLPVVSNIEFEEHQALLHSLRKVQERDLEGVTVHAGLNAANNIVVLLTTLTGYAVVSA